MRTANKVDYSSARNPGHKLYRAFLHGLAEMHSAEKQLTMALPIVAKAARSEDLKKLVEVHLKETHAHVETLEAIAAMLDVKLAKKTCLAMRELIKETVGLLVHNLMSEVRDLALIAAARKIEHYEIASYGTLCCWSKEMGLTHETALLFSILGQEKMADTLLTGVGKGSVPLGELIQRVSLKKVKGSRPATVRRAWG